MSSVPAAARARARALVLRARSATAAPRHRRAARRLLAAGLVDRTWLARQARTEFAADAEAALWYVGTGRRHGASPHPLLEPEWVDPVSWRSSPTDPALRFAASAPAPMGAHPLADGAGELQSMLGDLAPSTMLGGPCGEVSFGEWSRVVARAQDVESSHAALKKVRTTRSWDPVADADYVSRWSGAELPEHDGPLVSIVMPVRNRPELVVVAIRSALAQSLTSFELLVVDDGSDDSTPDVVAALALEDPRVRLLRRPHGGVCAARNAAIDEAQGAYLAFLDSDNEWTPDFLRVSVAAMSAHDWDVAFAVVDEQSERGRRFRGFVGGAADLQMGNFVDLNVLVCRTEAVRAVGGFDPSLRRMVDYDLVWKLADRGPLHLLPFVGVRYRAHSAATDRITATESLAWDDVVKVRHMVGWEALAGSVDSRREGLVSVVVPLRSDRAAAVRSVGSVLLASTSHDVEVVVVDNAGTPGTWRLLWAEIGLDPRVTLVRAPVNLHRAGSVSYALPATGGATIVVLPAGSLVGAGGLDPLVAPVMRGEAALAVVREPGPGSAQDPVVMAVRARALIEARGLHPIFTNEFEIADLVRRIEEAVPGSAVEGIDVDVVVDTGYEAPTPAQHAANVREWHRRHPGIPTPSNEASP